MSSNHHLLQKTMQSHLIYSSIPGDSVLSILVLYFPNASLLLTLVCKSYEPGDKNIQINRNEVANHVSYLHTSDKKNPPIFFNCVFLQLLKQEKLLLQIKSCLFQLQFACNADHCLQIYLQRCHFKF